MMLKGADAWCNGGSIIHLVDLVEVDALKAIDLVISYTAMELGVVG